MKTLQFVIFALLICFTLAVYGQTGHPESAVDAVQNQRLEQVEQTTSAARKEITVLAQELASLRSSLDRFTGIGIGIGICLTTLQALLVILTYKKG